MRAFFLSVLVGIGSCAATPAEPTADAVTRGPQTFTASAVRVDGVHGDLSIQPAAIAGVVVEMTGPKAELDLVAVQTHGSTLVIEERSSTVSVRGRVCVSGSGDVTITGGNVSIVNGVVTIDGQTYASMPNCGGLKIAIKVPVGTPLQIDNVRGDVAIGDTQGALAMTASGSWDVRVGEVRETRLIVSGSSDVVIDEIAGSLSVIQSGSSDIRVLRGEGVDLTVQTSGSGDIVFRGRARNATLNTSGSGDIEVGGVDGTLTQRASGSGDIIIDTP